MGSRSKGKENGEEGPREGGARGRGKSTGDVSSKEVKRKERVQ